VNRIDPPAHPPITHPNLNTEEHDKLSLEKKQAIVDSCPTRVYRLDERENVRTCIYI
jgi:hypothetical protein